MKVNLGDVVCPDELYYCYDDGLTNGMPSYNTSGIASSLYNLPVYTPSGAGSGTSTNAGLNTLTSLTNAALSRLTLLPGQAGIQAGQSITQLPNGSYQITQQPPGYPASGASLSAGLSSLSGLLPLLLIGGLAVLVLGKK